MRYESHQLIYKPENEDPLIIGGMLGAALLAALLVNTDEGDKRGIALETDEERKAFFAQYERELIREDGGLLSVEIRQLNDAYVQLELSSIGLIAICPSTRLLDLALQLVVDYMHQLVIETFREHIWEFCPWQMPFPKWLRNAAHSETRRQLFLQIDWTDPPAVSALAAEKSAISNLQSSIEEPSFFFEGEAAADIMERYLLWLSDEYVAMKQEIPGAKITSADRKQIFAVETDWTFLSDEVTRLSPDEQKDWQQWQLEWSRFLTERLLPKKEIRFWADDVPEEIQAHLLFRLQLMEQHPAHFRDLTTSVYAMRQLGYIRRKCSDRDIRQWLSEHLKLDYTERNNASQFRRAMKEHGRYTPEVRDEVMLLERMGYFRFSSPNP